MINISETGRLKKLLEYNILDTPEESDFDELVELASDICEAPISLISLLDDKRQWFKAHQGLNVRETPKEISFCQHAIRQENIFLVNDALLDLRFKNNPLVTGFPEIRFYAGMPLTTNEGFNLGTLCVIDKVPRTINETQQKALKTIAKQVVKQLDLKLIYNKVNIYNNLLETERAQLLESNKTKDKIFSIVAHDLRTPLINIKSVLELYGEGNFNEEELNFFIKNLIDTVKLTSEMLDGLLIWAKSQLKNVEPIISKFPINELILKEISFNKSNIDKKEILVKTDFCKNIEVLSDAEMLTIVIRNLLSNALKFSNFGGVILISTELNDNNLIVRVSDSGKGISKENIVKIFKETEYISTYGTNNEKGIGIGLHLCKALLNKNNGKIWVESEIDKGTTFSFSIPLIV